MSTNCAICQDSGINFHNIYKTKIGTPLIIVKELLLQIFEEEDELPNDIGKYGDNQSSLCMECENKLLEYYDATLRVSAKRKEFQQLVRPINFMDVKSSFHEMSMDVPWSDHNDGNSEAAEDVDDIDWEVEYKPDIKHINLKSLSEDSDEDLDCLANIKTKIQSTKAMRYCLECDVECPTEKVFELHMQKVHAAGRPDNIDKSLCCPDCNEELPTEHAFKQHIKKKHKVTMKFTCSVCERAFNKRSNLIVHEATHSSLTCSHCNIKFEHKRAIKLHMLSQHPDVKEFQCDECGNLYISSKSLKKHKMVHSDTRNFNCDECPRRFRNSSHLNRHKLTHSGLKPHVCPVCFRTFALKYNMFSHMKEHAKPGNLTKRPECNACGQFFTAQQLLNNHLAAGRCVMADVEVFVKNYVTRESESKVANAEVPLQNNKAPEGGCIMANVEQLSQHNEIHEIPTISNAPNTDHAHFATNFQI